jgi:SPP1 family predicted phage head-tail adaptor
MIMDDVINLISQNGYYDSNKVYRTQRTSRQIFAKVESITRSEFFNAGRIGLNPQLLFRVFKADYQGESIVEYNGKTYSVYRTFDGARAAYVGPNTKRRQELLNDYIELYTEQKAGTDGESNNG